MKESNATYLRPIEVPVDELTLLRRDSLLAAAEEAVLVRVAESGEAEKVRNTDFREG